MLANGSQRMKSRSLTPPKPPIAKFAQGKRGFGIFRKKDVNRTANGVEFADSQPLQNGCTRARTNLPRTNAPQCTQFARVQSVVAGRVIELQVLIDSA